MAGTVARRRLYAQQGERLNKVELLNKKEPIPEQYASDIGSPCSLSNKNIVPLKGFEPSTPTYPETMVL